jgi:hypothetical protein
MVDGVYEGHGIRFRYPAHWALSEQEDERLTSITVDSPETSSWSISLSFDGPSPEQVVSSAIEAFREEYAEVDVYPAEAKIGDHASVAQDVDFVCFELISSAFLRAFRAEQFTVLILYQGFDGELETARPLLEAISASLSLDDQPVAE